MRGTYTLKKRGLVLCVDGVDRFVTESEIRNAYNESRVQLGANDKNIMDAAINHLCQMMDKQPNPMEDLFPQYYNTPKSVDAIGKLLDNEDVEYNPITPMC